MHNDDTRRASEDNRRGINNDANSNASDTSDTNSTLTTLISAGDSAIRNMSKSLAKIDFDQIAHSINAASRSVLQRFGKSDSIPSPYIVCEEKAERRGRNKQWRGFALLFFMSFPSLMLALSLLFADLIPALMMLGFALGIGWWSYRLIKKGTQEAHVAVLLKRMSNTLGMSQKISLASLANTVDVPLNKLIHLLKQALFEGLIPEGRLASYDGTPMLYLTEAAQREDSVHGDTAVQSASTASSAAAVHNDVDISELPPDAQEFLRACKQAVDSIRLSALSIRDTEVRILLESIAKKTESLGSYVLHHPLAASQLHRVATYYLPTTSKFAASYVELERHSTGEQTRTTLAEIRTTLDQVNDALTKLSDDVVLDQSIDLSADMEVMRTMLKQDGLDK